MPILFHCFKQVIPTVLTQQQIPQHLQAVILRMVLQIWYGCRKLLYN